MENKQSKDWTSVREHVRRLRDRAMAHLGGKCVRCGFADPRALQFDHVYGTTKEARISHARMYHEILEGSTEYQLLCANCNWIKRFERGEHRNGLPAKIIRRKMYSEVETTIELPPDEDEEEDDYFLAMQRRVWEENE